MQGKFDAGGVNLYLICLGQGSPTAVFDAAWGSRFEHMGESFVHLRYHVRSRLLPSARV